MTSIYWEDHPDQTATVYLKEVAPNVDPQATEKYQTWFWRNWQPDGICMNCRQRPGLMDPIGGSYTCDECRAECEVAMKQYIRTRRAAS